MKRVFYVKYLASTLYEETLTARADVTLERLENDTPEAEAAPVLAAAHAYQIGAARDEIAPRWHVTEALLARAPNLLAVSSNGAGYDTIDVAACTRAGLLAVNQSGGNREAVAEHALGMMLALSKRIVECDRAMRRAPGIDRGDYIGHDIHGRTVGIIGLGQIGSRIAELCGGPVRDESAGLRPVSRRGADHGARGGEGDARGAARAIGFRLGQLPAQRRDAGHDRRGRVRADAVARLFRDHRARRHP